MNNNKHLTKHSKSYYLLKSYTHFAFNIFYSDVQVTGTENIPTDSPVIFAPNHQNALMDALSIIVHIKKQPVFMARADIFSGSLTKKFLHLFKIIPVFRIRDGVEALSQNDRSFATAVQILASGNCLGMMPEGTDNDKHRLRPLKKGIARLAFQAQSELPKGQSVKIVPVGIHYSHYQDFRSKIAVNFGKPIDILDYSELYNTNPQKALSDVREAIACELKQRMLHIEDDTHYELLVNAKNIAWYELCNKPVPNYGERYVCEKDISKTLENAYSAQPQKAEELNHLVTEYNNLRTRHKLPNEIFEGLYPRKEFYWDIARFLFFLAPIIAGTLFNLIPALITRRLSSKIKDPQFVSSFKFAIGLISFTVYYLLFLCLPAPFLAKVICILAMPILGVLASDYFKGLRIFLATVRFRRGLAQNEPSFSCLQQLRSDIVSQVKKLMTIQ
ncbi:MAG TPA: lysophospholipid acyltransferase family protein [Bacteroidales bacterium]|nr:lysophospholipid acyltransferase family protein [Bacteroidales bacterium]